jgi:hypothetical protein
MPRQVYSCPKHGEFEVTISYDEDIPKEVICCKRVGRYSCVRKCPWIPSAPNFIGGPTTGAKKE